MITGSQLTTHPQVPTASQRKGRVFLIAGLFALAAAQLTLTRFHWDFASGTGYGLGIGALITSIVFMRRAPSSTGDRRNSSTSA